MTLPVFAAATAIVAVSALLQGTIGFGLALLAAPLLRLLAPELVPGPMLVASGLLTVLMARRDWDAVQGGDLGWALGGRVTGTAAAIAVLAVLPAAAMDRLFGALVLAGVAFTAAGLRFRPAPRSLVVAGVLSGFMGTTTSIGGPPIALLYQHETARRIRGTLAAFFVAGVAMSVTGLALAGRFGLRDLRNGLFLLPGIVLGYQLSHLTAGRLEDRCIRPAVLVVSGVAAALVALR